VGPKTWFRLDPEPIKKGARGNEVKLLQELLKHLATRPNSLAVDGIVGLKTWATLKS